MKNRHLLETARALLFHMHVPKHFWADAVSTACFFINQMPSSVLNWDTPYHILFPNKPLFPIEPRIFGCTCFVRDVRPQVSKLDHKSLKCIFLGYSRVHKGYRCYCPNLRRYLVFADVKFFENIPFSSPPTHTSQGEADDLLVYTIASPVAPPVPAPVSLLSLRSTLDARTHQSLVLHRLLRHQIQFLMMIALLLFVKVDVNVFIPFPHFAPITSCLLSQVPLIASLDSISLSNTFQKALSYPSWRSAMIEEMDALNGNGTGNLELGTFTYWEENHWMSLGLCSQS